MKRKNINSFNKFVLNFDTKQTAIKRKWDHSIRVAKIAYNISKSLKLDKNDCNLAFNIGLLHDIARFEQWTKFKTFNDLLSIDHGDLALNILFRNNIINNFIIDNNDYSYIEAAIKYHNKLEIDTKYLKQISMEHNLDYSKLLTHCMIVRDADKLDIFDILISKHVFTNNNNLKVKGISKKVLNHFHNREACDHKNVKTILDKALSDLCMAFDLYYDYSIKIFRNKVKEYCNSIYNTYSQFLKNEDCTTLQNIINDFINHFQNL